MSVQAAGLIEPAIELAVADRHVRVAAAVYHHRPTEVAVDDLQLAVAGSVDDRESRAPHVHAAPAYAHHRASEALERALAVPAGRRHHAANRPGRRVDHEQEEDDTGQPDCDDADRLPHA